MTTNENDFTYDHIRCDIITVEDRHRKDLGNIDGLAERMEKHGQLHPIGLTEELGLVFGERRLRAAQKLGWKYIRAKVGPFEDLLEVELTENYDRKDFNPIEMVEIGREIEEVVAAKADKRKKATQYGAGNLPAPEEGASDPGRARDQVAKALGTSGRNYEKAKAVVEAAEADPERYGKLVEQMQRTGKVNAPYNKLKKSRDEDRILGLEPVDGKFHTLIMDVPWIMDWLSETGQAAPGYAMMTLDEIEDIDPGRWAADDFCHLYMWTPNNFIREACRLVEIWGFDHRTVLTWKKPDIGMGHYFRNDTEHVLFATRGKQVTRVDDIRTCFEGNTGVTEHSSKPEEFYDIVQKASYPPFGEAFGRRPHDWIDELYQKVVSEEVA